jgi:hypothetical protein
MGWYLMSHTPQAGAKLAWKLVTKTGTRTCPATSCGIVSALPNGADAFRGLAVRHKTPVEPEKQPPRTIEVLAPVEPRQPPIRYLGPVGIRSGRQSFR